MPARSTLECLAIDSFDPVRLSRFWSTVLGAQQLEQDDDGVRLGYPGLNDFFLDFYRVPDRAPRPHRLHLDVFGGDRRDELVQVALAAGAVHLDIGQGDVPWVVLGDPEDYAFRVMPQRRWYRDTGPIAGIPIDADDVPAANAFRREAFDWVADDENIFRHPSGYGPLIAFTEPVEPKRGKNPMHLDLRVAPGQDYEAELARLLGLGARRLQHNWGELNWTVLVDPGNNEFCLLRPITAG